MRVEMYGCPWQGLYNFLNFLNRYARVKTKLCLLSSILSSIFIFSFVLTGGGGGGGEGCISLL